jgi:hypothetical protein
MIRDWKRASPRWKQDSKNLIVVVGTHCDEDPAFSLHEPLTYQSRVEDANDELLAFAGRVGPKRIVVGSLANEYSARQTLRRAIKPEDLK